MIELCLNGIEVDCIIGERPDERTRTQRLIVDVALKVAAKADETDELCDTVDYAELSERIRSALVEAKCKMLERAAKVAYDVCRADERVVAAEVRVEKFGSVPGMRSASVRCVG